MVPSPVSVRQVFNPSHVSVTLTSTFLAMRASVRPSFSMPSNSVAATSALTGPGTSAQISAMISRKSRRALATSEGLVVTPSSSPVAAKSLISPTSAVSTKNFTSWSSTLSALPVARIIPSARDGGSGRTRRRLPGSAQSGFALELGHRVLDAWPVDRKHRLRRDHSVLHIAKAADWPHGAGIDHAILDEPVVDVDAHDLA